jgi:hypothetical protein
MGHRYVELGGGESPARVELVSPYSRTQSGFQAMISFSTWESIRAVISPCIPVPA